jgi:hypothetical protein
MYRPPILVEHDGLTLSLSDWARRIGRRPDLLADRLRRGWSIEELLSKPPGPTGRRGVPGVAKGRLPDTPTAAMPGTPEKIEVMRQRAAAGRQVFHPADARDDDGRKMCVLNRPESRRVKTHAEKNAGHYH